MKKIYVLAGVALMMTACGNNEKEYDATGTFEAIETTVFAEQSGALLSFDVNEGDMDYRCPLYPQERQGKTAVAA